MVSFEQIILGSQEEKHRIMMKFADTTRFWSGHLALLLHKRWALSSLKTRILGLTLARSDEVMETGIPDPHRCGFSLCDEIYGDGRMIP